MSDLVLVRHGVTELNEALRYQGWSDPPLTADGEARARRLGARLREEGVRPAAVWSSDLVRARRTAELVFPGEEARSDRRLRELSFGALEGRSHDEAVRKHGAEYRRWLQDPESRAPPDGESLPELRERVGAWLERLSGPGPVAVVAHGGSLAVLLARVLALPARWEVERGLRLPPASAARCSWPLAEPAGARSNEPPNRPAE